MQQPSQSSQTSPQPSPQQPQRGLLYFLWNNAPRFVLLLLILGTVALVFEIGDKKETLEKEKAAEVKEEKPPVNVVTMKLVPATITDRLNLPGTVEPWTDLSLLAKIGGTITELMVKEGDHVKTGDIIARIEQDDYKIAVQRAQAAYDLARIDFERDQKMYKRGATPIASLDTNRTKMETAKADLDHARLQLSRTNIASPMDGVVRTLQAKVGLQLSVGDPVAEILETDRMKAVIGIPESDVSAISHLEKVEVQIKALDDAKITGTRYFLAPSTSSVARLYNLELALDNREGNILAGMFVRADIVKSQVPDSLAVPLYSVISRNDEQYVFIEDGGVARKRSVTLGILEGWMIQVTSGLEPGDNLIVEGHRDVDDNQPVNIVKQFASAKDLHK